MDMFVEFEKRVTAFEREVAEIKSQQGRQPTMAEWALTAWHNHRR